MKLPAGLTSRVLTLDDARAVYDVAAAQAARCAGQPNDGCSSRARKVVPTRGSIISVKRMP